MVTISEYEFEYPTRCTGPDAPYGILHKCGRFLAHNTFMCARCQAEADAAWEQFVADEIEADERYDEMLNQFGEEAEAAWRAYIGDMETYLPTQEDI